jgi:hypothetical protein
MGCIRRNWMTGKTRLLLPLLGSLLATHATAQTSITHSGLLETDYSRARQSGVQETDTATVLATMFLEEVNHGSVPHSQAAFLERASSLTMAWADLDADFGPAGETGGDAALVDLEYIMQSHWIVGAAYSRFRLSRLSEQETHTLEFGRYLDDTSTILGTFARTEDKIALLPDSLTRTWGIEYKNLTRHPTANTSLTLDLKYQHIDASAGASNMVGAQGEYHFTLASSVVAGVEVTSGEDKGTVYSLGLTHYVTRFVAIGSEFSRDRPDRQPHTNTLKVYARLLF